MYIYLPVKNKYNAAIREIGRDWILAYHRVHSIDDSEERGREIPECIFIIIKQNIIYNL